MDRRLFVLALIIVGLAFGLEIDSPWFTHSRTTSSAMEIPPDPTFYTLMTLDSWIPSGGAQIIIIGPRRPLNATVDTSWNGMVTPQFITDADYDVDSVYCVDMSGLPMSEIPVGAEMGMAFVRAEGEGYFSTRVIDSYGEMKPSLPVLFEVVPSGTVPTRWTIFGEDVVVQDNHFDLHWAAVTDMENLVVPSYLPGIHMDYVTAEIVYESNPNGSAGISNPFDMMPAPSADLAVIYGMAPFYVYDTERETLGVIAYSSAGTLMVSDTFWVRVAATEDAPYLLTNRFEGMRIAQQKPASIYAMAFTRSEPDPSNNSTKVRLSAIDLTGSESATIEPDSWRRLTGGFAGFTLTDSEADTLCVFIDAETDSVPELVVPFYTPIQVVPPDVALKFVFKSPHIGLVGDSLKLIIEGINGWGEVDTTLNAWFTVDLFEDDTSVTIIDSASGDSWNANLASETGLHMTDGRYVLYIVDTESETLYFEADDAEHVGLFDQGLIGFLYEYEVIFEEYDTSGALEYSFEPVDVGIYPIREDVELTVTARTGSGLIDASYSGTASVTASGFAELEPPSGLVEFEDGIATVTVSNDSAERVDMEISGPLMPDMTSILFLDPVSGGVLFPFEYEGWFPVGTEQTVLVGVMNLEGVDVTYDGWADITVIDPNDNGSITAPDSVEISGGLGSFDIVDADAERFTLVVDSGDEEVGYFEMEIESRALLNAELPCGCEVGALLDSILYTITDTAGHLFAYTCTLELRLEESNPNFSVSYNEEIYITDGHGMSLIENTEAETLDVYIDIPTGQYVYAESTLIDEWEYYLGQIVYIGCNIGEASLPEKFDIGPVVPNPFNATFAIDIMLPQEGDVDIDIYDVNGRLVLQRELEKYPAGRHKLAIDLHSMPSGIYWIKAVSGESEIIRKGVLIR